MHRIEVEPQASARRTDRLVNGCCRPLHPRPGQCAPDKRADHRLETCREPAPSAEVAVLRPEFEDNGGLSKEEPLYNRMGNSEKAPVEAGPAAKVSGRTFRRQDVEQHAGPPGLALTNNRKPECGDHKH